MNTGVEIDSFVKEMENMEKAENEEKEEEKAAPVERDSEGRVIFC